VAHNRPAPFDLLGSASFLVEDAADTAEALVNALGFPPPKPHWRLDLGPAGMAAIFMRPQYDVIACPTPIELVQSTPIDPATPWERQQPQIRAIELAQRDRPVKAHATDLAAAEPLRFAARFEQRGVRHWVHTSVDGVPRVWVGVDPADQSSYTPSEDAHLHIEVLPTGVLGLRPAALNPPALDPRGMESGTMIRVAWRTYLVHDLGHTLAVVDHLLDWRPERPPEKGAGDALRALLGFRVPTSTRLELLQPGSGTEERDALDRWGEGPWSMTLAVQALETKRADLQRRGTAHRWVNTGFARPSRVVRVDRSATPGCSFDLAELSDTWP
jgi:hypothetical protein